MFPTSILLKLSKFFHNVIDACIRSLKTIFIRLSFTFCVPFLGKAHLSPEMFPETHSVVKANCAYVVIGEKARFLFHWASIRYLMTTSCSSFRTSAFFCTHLPTVHQLLITLHLRWSANMNDPLVNCRPKNPPNVELLVDCQVKIGILPEDQMKIHIVLNLGTPMFKRLKLRNSKRCMPSSSLILFFMKISF